MKDHDGKLPGLTPEQRALLSRILAGVAAGMHPGAAVAAAHEAEEASHE